MVLMQQFAGIARNSGVCLDSKEWQDLLLFALKLLKVFCLHLDIFHLV